MLLVGSLQIASARAVFPATTSRNPIFASGASARVSDGLRRSQSTRITLAPVWAISVVIDAAMVDLPSLGEHDVRPLTLGAGSSLLRSSFSFIHRMASAYGDDGESITVRHTFEADRPLLEGIRSIMDMGRIALLPDGPSMECWCRETPKSFFLPSVS